MLAPTAVLSAARWSHTERLRALWDYLRTSLWFVPVLMMFAAVPLTAGVLALDARLSEAAGTQAPWFVYVGDSDDARNVLATILSSMITMVSLVFSITMVVLSLAANQFGPRLVRSFMSSPQTQIVLGAFVMTIIYCLFALASVGPHDGPDPVPCATVTVAIGLGVLSVALLVLHLHGLARSIVSETVIERVAAELDGLMEEFEPLPPAGDDPGREVDLPEDFEERLVRFGPDKAGYVQAIDFEQLAAAAQSASIVVRLGFRAGDFVVEGGSGVGVYPGDRLSERAADALKNAILIGAHRTPVQDPTFSIRHMVEIAVRALSPGVNDPYTATAAVDQLSVCLCRLMRLALPTGLLRDADGVVRVISPSPTYASLLAAAFDQIRQNGADKPIVLIHLLESLGRIADHTQRREQREAVRRQLQILDEAAKRNIRDPSDLADVIARSAAARSRLDRMSTKAGSTKAGPTKTDAMETKESNAG